MRASKKMRPSRNEEVIFPGYTPPGVMTNILSRLPVKSLLEYKSVSKSWYSLISSPYFITSQLAFACARPYHNIIVHNCDFYEDESYSSISLINLDSRQIERGFDNMPAVGSANGIVGSANGIVCVGGSNVYLWNPATKQYRVIDSDRREAIGFGFDPIDNDLKVVAHVALPSPAMEVYSVNRNVWRNVPPNHTDFHRNFHVCVNGFLFTVGQHGMNMIAFDLHNEVLKRGIKLPVATFHFTFHEFELSDAQARIIQFNSSIAAIISKRQRHDSSFQINFWALDDEACFRSDEIEASWTLMYNINVSRPVQFLQTIFNTGDILLLVDDVWCLYDPDTEEFKTFPDTFHLSQIFPYKESLVTIAGSKQVNLNPPDYVVTKILLCLPVNSLLRFKSVCKSWFSFITSPDFAKKQLLITEAREPNQVHIVHSYSYKDKSKTAMLLIDLLVRQIVAVPSFPSFRGEFPCMPRLLLVGSACGIVCVLATFSIVSRIYLWNPATKQSKRVPSYKIRNADMGRVVLGFGFDSISNDFKVVRVVSPSFPAELYSANGNAWRNVERNPIDFPIHDNFDVCVNGFLCTAGRHGMIAFDLNTEVFNCGIKFPAPTFDERITEFNIFDHHARITEYHDSIAVIICKRSDYDCKIELWSLDNEECLRGGGVQASWTRSLNIIVKQPVQFVQGYFNGGDFLLSNNDVWYLYNPDNAEADLCIPGNETARNIMNSFFRGQIFRYTKSLFKITGSRQGN